AERHAVDVEHHVEAPFGLAFDHGDLVDGQPVVVGRVVAEQSDGRVVFRAVGIGVDDAAQALGEVTVDAMVLRQRVARGGGGDLVQYFVDLRFGQLRVQPGDGVTQPAPQYEVLPRLPLPRPRRDPLAFACVPGQLAERVER